MEIIRIIRKNEENQVIKDGVIQVPVNLNPIDKPAYVEFREAIPKKMVFAYPQSKEKVGLVTSANGHFSVEYGKLSGRIRSVVSHLSRMSETDRYNLGQAILADGSGIRFRRNVESQMNLVEKLLPEFDGK